MEKKHLSVSIVIASYNSERTIGFCLESVRSQVYPKDKIEIIIADGNSRDNTRNIAKNYGAKIIPVDPKKQNAEYNKSIGIQKAKGEIILMLDHDNIMPHKMWLATMINPLLKHAEVVGVETLRYHYDPDTTLLDRYFALFGAGDPLVWYLGKADRLSYIYDDYNLLGSATDYGDYYLVRFSPVSIPTIGANGFAVRRKILMKHAKADPGEYFDMDVNVDLIKKGYNTYAFVKDSILHLTGYGSIWYFLKRRLLFVSQYHMGEKSAALKSARRYKVFEKKDIWRLIWFIIISLTIVVPLYDSFRGWRKIRDKAWFLHPFMCFSFVVMYSFVVIKHCLFQFIKPGQREL